MILEKSVKRLLTSIRPTCEELAAGFRKIREKDRLPGQNVGLGESSASHWVVGRVKLVLGAVRAAILRAELVVVWPASVSNDENSRILYPFQRPQLIFHIELGR
jgi:hypothetical protein